MEAERIGIWSSGMFPGGGRAPLSSQGSSCIGASCQGLELHGEEFAWVLWAGDTPVVTELSSGWTSVWHAVVAVETSSGTHVFRKVGKDQEHLADFLLGLSPPALILGNYLNLREVPFFWTPCLPPQHFLCRGGPCLKLPLTVGRRILRNVLCLRGPGGRGRACPRFLARADGAEVTLKEPPKLCPWAHDFPSFCPSFSTPLPDSSGTRESRMCSQGDAGLRHTDTRWKQPESPSAGKWTHNMWPIHTMACCLVINGNEVLIHDTAWMNLHILR